MEQAEVRKPTAGSEERQSRQEADRRQDELVSNTVGDVSVTEQIANVASMLPLSGYFKLRVRILKLGAFCDNLQNWLEKDAGVKPPMHNIALMCMFIVASYLPMLVLTIFYTALIKKPEKPRFDPSLFAHNQQDAVQSQELLKLVRQLQKDLQEVTGEGGQGSKGGVSNKETDKVLLQTQKQIDVIADGLQTIHVSVHFGKHKDTDLSMLSH